MTGSDVPSHRIRLRRPGRVPLHLLVEERLPIGRAGEGLLLDDERVSRHHCELLVDGGLLVVRDLGSSNGTIVNGSPIAGATALRPGDVLDIGDVVIDVIGPLATSTRPDLPPSAEDVRATVVGRSGASVPAGPQPDELDGVASEQLRASVVGTTLTIVVSDIVDSTGLVHRLGDREWLALLGRHDAISRRDVARHRGTVVKGQGDGFLLTFPSARHALLAATAVQRSLAEERRADPGFLVRVRIGVHTGEVLHADGDLFGRHVHRAARVAAAAGPDEILASALVRELAETMGDLRFGPAADVELKGFEGAQQVHRLEWAAHPGAA